jgi:hypothetical protein
MSFATRSRRGLNVIVNSEKRRSNETRMNVFEPSLTADSLARASGDEEPPRRAQRARADRTRASRGGPHRPRHRRPSLGHAQDGRDARPPHPRQTRATRRQPTQPSRSRSSYVPSRRTRLGSSAACGTAFVAGSGRTKTASLSTESTSCAYGVRTGMSPQGAVRCSSLQR